MNRSLFRRPRHRWFRLIAATLIVLGGLLASAPAPVAAATCVVTSTNSQGAGTLKDCVAAAASGDTITFNLPNPSTIALSFGGIPINKSLTITGPGASKLTISGSNAFRVFDISGGTVQISGLTIANGRVIDNPGGGLQQTGGTLTLDNVVVENNRVNGVSGGSARGGGIAIIGGTATLNATTVRANTVATTGFDGGGGLYVSNEFAAVNVALQGGTTITGNTVTDSTFRSSGGGIMIGNFRSANTPQVTITDSVVSNNSAAAQYSSGGISNLHSDSLPGATVALTNTTVSGNTPGGIFSTDGALTLTNSTLSANIGTGQNFGAGVQSQGGTLTVTGGTISGNGGDGIAGSFGTLLAVTNATVSGNRSGIGNSGGGTLTVTGSTISGSMYSGINFVTGSGSVTNSTSSGNGNSGIVNFATLTVTNSTVTDNHGGGIFNGGTLTLTGSMVSGNQSTGILNNRTRDGNGILTVVNSTISGNTQTGFPGGGIYTNGTAVVTGSTISGNTSLVGGGILNGGTLALTNSTLSGNTASDAGGGLFNSGDYATDPFPHEIVATLAFVTITGNTAVNYGSGLITTVNTTTLIGRSIVVGNRRGNESDDCATNSVALAPLTSQGYNVFGVAARCPTAGTGDVAVEDAATVLNPTLAANGGPTKTHALVAGSPALNRVPTANCAAAAGVDQRGTTRPQGAGCDSGAVETTGTPNATGTAPPACTVVTSAADRGAGTLRQCVASAAPGATITFNLALPATITLTTGAIVIDKSLTIQGPGAGSLTLDGAGRDRLFVITTGTVALSGLMVRNGSAPTVLAVGGAGIAIEPTAGVSPTVALTDLVIRDNITGRNSSGLTERYGGGVYVRNGTLTLTNSAISGNTIQHNGFGNIGGAGLAVVASGTGASASATLVNSTIADNLTRIDTSISGNNPRSKVEGGGIYALNSALNITGSAISGNAFVRIDGNPDLGNFGQGGGIFASGGTLALTNSTVSGNVASTGGGIYGTATAATLSFATVTGNTATKTTGGGGLEGASFGVAASIVAGNRRGTASPVASDCVVTTSTSGGYNVVGSGTGCPSGGPGDTTASDPATVLNPALAANGGPTKTHALVAGSPALDRVPTANCAAAAGVDQRGGARPLGAGCDSGAFEGVGTAVGGLALTLTVVGGGQVQLAPPGTVSGGGTFPYAQGTLVTLTPQPAAGQTFTGWAVDGAYTGWANPLTLTMDASHSIQATFAPTKTFPDVPGDRADAAAIAELASRTTIRGYGDGTYGPDDGVQRAQMAALIARATSAGPGTPTGGTLTPPACLVGGTWDCEDWGNGFTDRNGLDANLWRNVGALQHYQVAFGYDGAACAAQGVAAPCYAPTAAVSYVETIVFITRAMVAKGYWVLQPNAPQPYAGVPEVFTTTVATYQFYTAGAGGVPAAPANWNAGATRGWFARALWQALNTYWATDGNLPDGRPAGGFVQ